MTFADLEHHFSKDLLAQALRDSKECGWHVGDVPDVIEAARKAGLAISGCNLRVFVPEDIGGGTCECPGVQFFIGYPVSTELPWPELVEKTAQDAIAEFSLLKTKWDFLKEGKKAAEHILTALGKPNADIEKMLGFVLHFCDDSPVENRPEKTGDAKILEDAFTALWQRGDYKTARSLAQPLADKGNPVAQLLIGDTYSRFEGVDEDLEEQLKWYRKAAAQGHAQAWYLLHMRYAWGQGVDKDLSEAAQCLRKAAEQGHVMACSFLGPWYRDGKGVKKDYSEAFKWLQLAAAYGRPESQGELGLMYLWGIGRPENYEEAYFWLSLAVQTPWNCIYLPKRYEAAKHLTPEQIEAVKTCVAEWKKTPLPPEANAPYFS